MNIIDKINAKQINPNVITVVGGGMITADAVPAMEAFGGNVDYGVIGEGEQTMIELVRSLHNKTSINDVNGLIYKEQQGWKITSRREDEADLDLLPLPDYEGFDYDKYLSTNGEIENGVKYIRLPIKETLILNGFNLFE